MRGRDWAWLGWSAAYLGLQIGTPLIQVPLEWVRPATLVSTLFWMATVLGLLFSLARLLESRRWLAPVLLAGGVMAWALSLQIPAWLGWSAQHTPPMWAQAVWRGGSGYFLMLGAVGLGAIVSWVIREKNLLVPAVPLAAAIDVLTVLAPEGAVRQIVEKAPEVVEKASVAITAAPSVAGEVARVMPIALIGVGDFVFLTLYLTCLYRFGLRVRATAIGLFLVLWLYLMVVAFGVVPALPGLVPMALVVLGVNWREFQLSRQEKVASLLTVGMVLGLIGWLFWR
ncbi:hypothetical protein GBSOP10_104322 [Armatimonadetes bacterium GBS]|jgi:hypothetical protein|nr:hypothetical protein HRbin14_02115 [bacterium HR14]GIV13493.1 MAG: hypothetical protein KatS3mg021_1775 [Fimbriimonadales bacterium]CUU05591.1 hypothetical protein GBSOP10_104322 [Armatimonadetes bacterium GBS]